MNNTSVRGTAANAVGYTGVVTLYQKINSKKHIIARVHNEGRVPLFNFLADCLAGDFDVAKADRPTKIMLLNENEEAGTRERAGSSSFIYLLTKPERVYSATEGIVRYSFLIPPEALIGAECNAIGLYNATASEADLDDYAAHCVIDLANKSFSLSSVLLIDWELHISNR